MLRFDWNAGQVHVITFTGQLALNGNDPQSIGSTSLPQVGGNNTGNSGSGGLQVTSRFNNGMVNAFRGGYTASSTNSTPFLFVPVGRVTNYSPLDSGGVAVNTFGFGGNAGMPRTSSTKTLEFTNELSLISPAGAHRWALGIVRQQAGLRPGRDHEPVRHVHVQLAGGFREQPARVVHTDAGAQYPLRQRDE